MSSPPAVFALGIDPGPSTGIGVLDLSWKRPARALQCNAAAAAWLLHQVCADITAAGGRARGGIEAFAPGHGAGAAKHGSAMNRQLEELTGICAGYGIPLRPRTASAVKAWATDKRLRAAELYDITAKAPDARDGMRHALMTAVQDCGWPDPLSRGWKAVTPLAQFS